MIEHANIYESQLKKLNMKIPHRNWDNAFNEAHGLISFASPGDVVSIYGPSRAGKTSLLAGLKEVLFDESRFNQDEQPLVMIEVKNNGGKASFSYKSFIIELLEILRHPIYACYTESRWGDPLRISRTNRATESVLEVALSNALIQRKTRFLFVDEAQDMKYAGKNVMAASAVMDALKTLAKSANVVLVVCGTYPILQSFNPSGHLENRKRDVHLARYRHTKDDLIEFSWILDNYESVLKLDDSLGSLRSCGTLLHDGSFGCIGLVKAWLHHASILAAIEGERLGLSHIERSQKAPRLLITAETEIRDGEHLLGIFDRKEDPQKAEESKPKSKTTPKRKGKPFQSNPKRHAVENRL